MHIVLVEPEIPGNTGNIARLCAATGASLHLVRPLGFSVDDRYLKRAGLDYWHLVDIHYYDSVEEVLAAYPDTPRFLLTTHAHRSYTRVEYTKDSLLIFGKESAGLPEAFRMAHEDECIRIPMVPEARSLNLANSVSIVLYEALRQVHFDLEEGTI
ncbi:tRNA (cytidine(34)-2'-O)-methyltransferase [Acidaminococcus intestini]|uniref:tRNA (cytidine(34)-2'-O)-methyltransferase n=1 Tax=Acidaminococcus intestini TaxID=187327 RepID=UPI00033F8736|nr:tRNA (cytidine(34)-2'-O)-methyltransferase [Acidaminococcus intestini]CDB93638.1 putative tRNA (cytidine(34)-2'-O)-methyltransferase [Acidaminococcus intestini CAG:325]